MLSSSFYPLYDLFDSEFTEQLVSLFDIVIVAIFEVLNLYVFLINFHCTRIICFT